jgi:NAD+ kinase
MNAPAIGLVANPTKPDAASLATRLAHLLASEGARVIPDEAAAALMDLDNGVPLAAMGDLVDLVVILGGDGTLLRTASLMGTRVRPLAAINIGRLGFLTTTTADDMQRFVRLLASQSYQLSRRRTIEAAFTSRDGETIRQTGLNEVVVTRGAISRTVTVEVRIDGEFLNAYHGDGLLVATPTGSTAYSLSAGGPIIHPGAEVFCITPVCPHAIANRSCIVRDDVCIDLLPAGRPEELLLSIDGGDPFPLCRDQPVTLRRGPVDIPLITMPEFSFYGVLRQKLQWHGGNVAP